MLAFASIVVSLIVQWLKKVFGTSRLTTITIVVILSLVGGAMYYFLTDYGLWEQAVKIMVGAGAFYAFIIKSLEGMAQE